MERKKEENKAHEETRTERYKIAKCKILSYNKKTKELDINYNGYGIRIKNVCNINDSDTIELKIKGEIGKPNFSYKL